MRIGVGQGSNSIVHPHSSIFRINSIKKPQPQTITSTSSEGGAVSTRILPSIELPINEESEWELERMNSNQSLNPQKNKQIIFTNKEEIRQTSFEDGRVSGAEYTKFVVMESVVALLAFIGTFLAIFAYELEFDESDTILLEIILWTGFAVNIFLEFHIAPLIVFRYLQLIKYFKTRKTISNKTNLFTSGKLLYLGFEILIILLQPYPFFKGIRFDLYCDVEGVTYFYYLNDIFSLLIVLRLYIVVRLYLNISVYRSPRARRITLMYGAENDYLYACKCQMKDAPTKNVLLVFVFSIFVFAYMLRICERPLNRNDEVQKDFVNYSNSLWLMIITMTTVGYGDFFPRTHLGRAVILLVCIWGVFIVSLMVVSLNNILTLSMAEEKSLTVLKRLNLRKKLKEDAAHILTKVARIRINAKNNNFSYTNKYHLIHLKKYLNTFRHTLRQLKYTNDNGNVKEEMDTRFDIMGDTLNQLIQNQKSFEDILQNVNQKLLVHEKLQPGSINSFDYNS